MLLGLIGEKLTHSYSARIHRLFFELAGAEGEYRLIELKKDEVGQFLKKSLKEGFQGLNVTIPYKTAVLQFLDEISPEAEKIGAVNTVDFSGGMKGYNTDYYGILYTFLKNEVQAAGKRALVTGSGGSAKAVVTCLADKGIREIYMAGRDPVRAGEKFSNVTPVSYTEIEKYKPFDIVINTTPIGMYPNAGASPLIAEQLRGAGFLFDLIYNPSRTKLMETADALGIRNVNGLYMLVAQAVKAQQIWGSTEKDKSHTKMPHSPVNAMNDKSSPCSDLYGLRMIDAIYGRILKEPL